MGQRSHVKPLWLEITVHIDTSAHEALNAFLFDLGCQGVLTEALAVTAYLPLTPKSASTSAGIRDQILLFLGRLERIFTDIAAPRLEIRHIKGQDWDLQWRRFFRAQQVTEELLVLPPWEPMPHHHEGHVIQIDPGPAFGTGQHPTTQMCLRAMERLSLSRPWTMLDVGTGSGILAIYGAKLGARRILAIDTDPEAVRWAKRNSALNRVEDIIEISGRPLEQCENGFTLITANLTLKDILEVFSRLPPLLGPGGRLVLSGILRDQRQDLEARLSAGGFVAEETLMEQDWAAVIAGRAAGRHRVSQICAS